LTDVCALAALAALRNARFPEVEDDRVMYGNLTDKPLPMLKEPIAVTVFRVGNQLFVDPTNEEDGVFDAKLTVTTMKDGNICALQKGGDLPLSIEDIEKIVDIGVAQGKELRKALG